MPRYMRQRLLDEYGYPVRIISSRRPANALPTKPFPFMRLPRKIRRRVYIFAGLPTNFRIHLNYSTPTGLDEQFCTSFLECRDLQEVPQLREISKLSEQISHFIDGALPYPKVMLNRKIVDRSKRLNAEGVLENSDSLDHLDPHGIPFQLLYVSPFIQFEVMGTFWYENSFIVSRPNIGGLSALTKVPSFYFTCVTSLTISLNYWGDAINWDDGRRLETNEQYPVIPCHKTCPKFGYQELIGVPKTRKERAAMMEWYQLCLKLAGSILPNRLSLWIFCDVANGNVAVEILFPLLRQAPRLKNCGIRFRYGMRQRILSLLARSYTQRLTKKRSKIANTGFRFLDLPYELKVRILQFTDLRAPDTIIWAPCRLQVGLETPKIFISSKSILELHEFKWDCCGKCYTHEGTCYCHHRHGAFSTTCTCWMYPGEFFLVSREFRELSLSVFFSENKFCVSDPTVTIQPQLKTSTVSLEKFLSAVPRDGRRHLRYLTWSGAVCDNPSTLNTWLRCVDMLADQFDLSKLHFIVDMSSFERSRHNELLWGGETGVPVILDDRSQKEDQMEWDGALKMAQIMARQDGWTDVFFNLGFPGTMLYPGNRGRKETLLERIVVGRNYDALSRGKTIRSCDCEVLFEDAWCQRFYAHWDERCGFDPELCASPPLLGEALGSEGFHDSEDIMRFASMSIRPE